MKFSLILATKPLYQIKFYTASSYIKQTREKFYRVKQKGMGPEAQPGPYPEHLGRLSPHPNIETNGLHEHLGPCAIAAVITRHHLWNGPASPLRCSGTPIISTRVRDFLPSFTITFW